MIPLLHTCVFATLYSYCFLENGSFYTAIRMDDELHTFIDGELYEVIREGKLVK